MFSGIIQAVVPVHAIHEKNNLKQFSIILPNYLLTNLKIGSSISNNGCCLTVISIKSNLISFELIYETLKLTNMNLLRIGDLINIERSLNYNAEIGGHLMSGHIDCTGTIKKIIQSTHQKIFWFNLKNQTFQKYILPHGSIGIEGVSLTINKIIKNNIRICLTPYTAINTTLGKKNR
ncbi:riboflavin synthase subunit alpha [Candidatus Blochmannia ocreatus (nom. nud.)]|uniref:Riboflavin synthase n=1 Tax=Candidatus Blochmannia ocreatus (nom. nud.) TaxID=251538 RepID=A0ABY4SYG0_9ENTR|nr:riboflavin synthase subunit alpha [Candidatus Blochmannia ocreatus]URJ24874.1 riboflavin synthase subunit alpha [Candidatus Blochmannia ocreatus]